MPNIEKIIETLEKLPKRRISKPLEELLRGTSDFADSTARLCKNIYWRAEDNENLTGLLSELSSVGERYCLQRRMALNAMCKFIRPVEGNNFMLLHREMDISEGVSISHDEKTNTLRLTMPILLPLKSSWNSYLPDKIRYALSAFSDKYCSKNNQRLRISPAFVLFIHHYDEADSNHSRYRDYDNMEYSSILNALHSTLIFNDSAATCITMQMAVSDSGSFTEVVIAPVSEMLTLLRDADLSLYERKDENPITDSETP